MAWSWLCATINQSIGICTSVSSDGRILLLPTNRFASPTFRRHRSALVKTTSPYCVGGITTVFSVWEIRAKLAVILNQAALWIGEGYTWTGRPDIRRSSGLRGTGRRMDSKGQWATERKGWQLFAGCGLGWGYSLVGKRDRVHNTSRHVNFRLDPFVRLSCGDGAAGFQGLCLDFEPAPERKTAGLKRPTAQLANTGAHQYQTLLSTLEVNYLAIVPLARDTNISSP
ncbi:hypothetical protein ARMSODRAFT_982554 [Armillaria solidipes]|uniref:Uncharacterized protein n=1 Tax=Armillaria solidipes TaxID=1076256 RepID=A0A2H3B8B9_9AGAR|nr:hypothetical protein ARMSODRAFT_982554 [Armillaria solidipes]